MVVAYLPHLEHEDHPYLEPATHPFAGRIGGNQDFVVDRNDPKNVEVLKEVPDAAPRMTLAEIFDLRGFLSPDLWKFALLECIGKPTPSPEIESDPDQARDEGFENYGYPPHWSNPRSDR
jgi:hypothetical protein